MNTLKLAVFLSILISCTERENNAANSSSEGKSHVHGEAMSESSEKGDTSQWNAGRDSDGLVHGQIHPSDNDQTLAWLDSLQSPNKQTRDDAFNVYKSICLRSDGALSEAICVAITSYFETHPNEFLENYTLLNEKQKFKTIENIAFELYASGADSAEDIAEYFTKLKGKCPGCATNPTLFKLRTEVERQVREISR
jgi:hypothetical protein